MSLNKVMVIGHLGQDPEIRYTPAGMPVVNFSVATDEAYVDKDGKRQERAEWHRVVVAGKLALICREYLKRGRQVFVEGRLRTREWESNGITGRRTEIVASRVQFLGAPPADAKANEHSAEASVESGVVAETDIPF
jgi:single-strand DNA-binding protein